MNSWTCLLVEDAEQDQLVEIYTWIHIANLVAGFAAPLAGLLVAQYTLVPTMRWLYVFAAIMFTLKSIITYRMTTETVVGAGAVGRDAPTRASLGCWENITALRADILQRPQTLYTAGIMLIIAIVGLINGTFWAILVTEKLNVPLAVLSLFPFISRPLCRPSSLR